MLDTAWIVCICLAAVLLFLIIVGIIFWVVYVKKRNLNLTDVDLASPFPDTSSFSLRGSTKPL